MSLESFHHLIKHIYMKRKVNKKVGTCVHTLLKLQGTKLSIDYLKWKKEKQHKVTGINKRPISQTIYYCHISII